MSLITLLIPLHTVLSYNTNQSMLYTITKGLITQKLDNKTVIFDGEESVLYTFNETASYIFSKIKTKWDEEKIILSLVKKYGIKEKRAKKDVGELIAGLKKKKIISSLKPKK